MLSHRQVQEAVLAEIVNTVETINADLQILDDRQK